MMKQIYMYFLIIKEKFIYFFLINVKTAGGTGKPVFQFPYRDNTSRTALTESYQNSTGVGARWQVQLGIRYIFN